MLCSCCFGEAALVGGRIRTVASESLVRAQLCPRWIDRQIFSFDTMDKLHLSDRAEIRRAGAGTPIEPIKARKVTVHFTATRVDNPGPRADGDRLEPGGFLRRMRFL